MCCMVAGVEAPLRRGASLREVNIIGLDLAKNVFQAHGAGADDLPLIFPPAVTRVLSSFTPFGAG